MPDRTCTGCQPGDSAPQTARTAERLGAQRPAHHRQCQPAGPWGKPALDWLPGASPGACMARAAKNIGNVRHVLPVRFTTWLPGSRTDRQALPSEQADKLAANRLHGRASRAAAPGWPAKGKPRASLQVTLQVCRAKHGARHFLCSFSCPSRAPCRQQVHFSGGRLAILARKLPGTCPPCQSIPTSCSASPVPTGPQQGHFPPSA